MGVFLQKIPAPSSSRSLRQLDANCYCTRIPRGGCKKYPTWDKATTAVQMILPNWVPPIAPPRAHNQPQLQAAALIPPPSLRGRRLFPSPPSNNEFLPPAPSFQTHHISATTHQSDHALGSSARGGAEVYSNSSGNLVQSPYTPNRPTWGPVGNLFNFDNPNQQEVINLSINNTSTLSSSMELHQIDLQQNLFTINQEVLHTEQIAPKW